MSFFLGNFYLLFFYFCLNLILTLLIYVYSEIMFDKYYMFTMYNLYNLMLFPFFFLLLIYYFYSKDDSMVLFFLVDDMGELYSEENVGLNEEDLIEQQEGSLKKMKKFMSVNWFVFLCFGVVFMSVYTFFKGVQHEVSTVDSVNIMDNVVVDAVDNVANMPTAGSSALPVFPLEYYADALCRIKLDSFIYNNYVEFFFSSNFSCTSSEYMTVLQDYIFQKELSNLNLLEKEYLSMGFYDDTMHKEILKNRN